MARGMFGFLLICLLSTVTQQTDGRHIKSKLQNGYHNQEENYIYNRIERVDDYNTVENGGNDKDGYSAGEDERGNDSAGDDEGQESRRVFEWFSRLFQSTTPRATQTTETTTESDYKQALRERIFLRSLSRNLTEILFKLNDVQKQVSLALTLKEMHAMINRGKPEALGSDNTLFHGHRLKRDVSEVVKIETETKIPVVEKAVTKKNKSAEVKVNNTECTGDNFTNGRRAGSMATPTEVKNKLLVYLQESFQEIKAKILSLKNLKQAFSDNISFKIGYILANIDTLEVSMTNLKNNMDMNKQLWEDNKILELYDTLKVSNQAVSGLIEALKMYLDKLSYQRQPQTKPDVGFNSI